MSTFCRFQTMATTLAVDVLGCTGTNEERAELLHKIIQIAAELKSTMGNLFGFAAVMRALELPQVEMHTDDITVEIQGQSSKDLCLRSHHTGLELWVMRVVISNVVRHGV